MEFITSKALPVCDRCFDTRIEVVAGKDVRVCACRQIQISAPDRSRVYEMSRTVLIGGEDYRYRLGGLNP